MMLQRLSDKTGDVCGIAIVSEDEDLLMITEDGTMIRTPVDGIPMYGRSAAGVIVMRLADGKKIVNFTKMDKAEEEEEDSDELDEEGSEADTENEAAAEISDEEFDKIMNEGSEE